VGSFILLFLLFLLFVCHVLRVRFIIINNNLKTYLTSYELTWGRFDCHSSVIASVLSGAEVNGTLEVNDAKYHWNKDLGQYLEADFDVAYGGNWTKLDDDCYTPQNKIFVSAGCILAHDCGERRWIVEGYGCDSTYVPDVFFLSVILFLGTFGLAMFCRNFRSTGYFPSWVSDRKL